MSLTTIIIITFLLNIICGIYRAKTEKFWMKMLFIHLPIPLIAYFRITSGVSWKMIPVLVVAAFSGQFIGGRYILKRILKLHLKKIPFKKRKGN